MNKLIDHELLEIEEVQKVLENGSEEEKGRFTVNDIDSANWCMRKLQAINQQEQEFKMLAEKEIERIEKWLEKQTKSLHSTKQFFESLLQEYYTKERQKNAKQKVITTPYGKISSRKLSPKYVYDEEKVLEWARFSNPSLIRFKEELAKDEIKKIAKVVGNLVVDGNGEVIEGLHIEEQGEKILITLSDNEL